MIERIGRAIGSLLADIVHGTAFEIAWDYRSEFVDPLRDPLRGTPFDGVEWTGPPDHFIYQPIPSEWNYGRRPRQRWPNE